MRRLDEAWYNYVLDVLGFIPAYGDVADVINALDHARKGEYLFAGLSLISAIPVVGSFIGGPAKVIVKGGKLLSKAKKAKPIAQKAGRALKKTGDSLNKFSDFSKTKKAAVAANHATTLRTTLRAERDRVEQGLDKIEGESRGTELNSHMPQIRQALTDFVEAGKLDDIEASQQSFNEIHVRKLVRRVLEGESRKLLNEDDYGAGDMGYEGYFASQEGGIGWGYVPDSSAFNKAFVAPFTDILKQVFNLGTIILNVATFQLTFLFTFSPSKQKELLLNFKKRNEKVLTSMREITKGMYESTNGDFDMFMFMYNGPAYIATKIAAATPAAVKAFVYNTGLRDAASIIPGVGRSGKATSDDFEAAKATNAPAPEEPGLIGKLERLFFVAHYSRPGAIMTEEKFSVENELTSYFRQSGIQDKLDNIARQSLDVRKEYLDGVVKQAMMQSKVALDLTNAATPEAIMKALNSREAKEFKVAGGSLSQFQNKIKSSIDKTMKDEERRENVRLSLAKKMNKSPDDVKDNEVRSELLSIITLRAKSDLVGKLHEGSRSLQEQSRLLIMQGAIPEKNWPELSQSPLGKEYVQVHKEALAAIDSIAR